MKSGQSIQIIQKPNMIQTWNRQPHKSEASETKEWAFGVFGCFGSFFSFFCGEELSAPWNQMGVSVLGDPKKVAVLLVSIQPTQQIGTFKKTACPNIDPAGGSAVRLPSYVWINMW